jgi:hypothetical protein
VKLAVLSPPEGYGDVLSYGIIVHKSATAESISSMSERAEG